MLIRFDNELSFIVSYSVDRRSVLCLTLTLLCIMSSSLFILHPLASRFHFAFRLIAIDSSPSQLINDYDCSLPDCLTAWIPLLIWQSSISWLSPFPSLHRFVLSNLPSILWSSISNQQPHQHKHAESALIEAMRQCSMQCRAAAHNSCPLSLAHLAIINDSKTRAFSCLYLSALDFWPSSNNERSATLLRIFDFVY